MSSFIGFILEMLFPLILKALDVWIKTKDKEKAMVDSYYNFLQQIDQAGAAKVSQYLAAEDALKAKQNELRKELEEAAKPINPKEPERNPAVSAAMQRNFKNWDKK